MANMFFNEHRQYAKTPNKEKGKAPIKIGGTARTNKIKAINEERERIEELMINISFKANRAEKQREERQSKRS